MQSTGELQFNDGDAAVTDTCAAALTVLVPDAFRSAFDRITNAYLTETSVRVELIGGPAGGKSQEAITNRVAAGQHFDVALLPRALMDEHARAKVHIDQAPTDILRSLIGMCVAPGLALPSIENEESLQATLLEAKSIALSTAGSGEYVAGRLLERLGIADKVSRSAFE